MPRASRTPRPASSPKDSAGTPVGAAPTARIPSPERQGGQKAHARQVRTADAMGIVMRVVVAVAIVAAVLGVAFLVLSNTSTLQITSVDAVARGPVWSADEHAEARQGRRRKHELLLNVDTNTPSPRTLIEEPLGGVGGAWSASFPISSRFLLPRHPGARPAW